MSMNMKPMPILDANLDANAGAGWFRSMHPGAGVPESMPLLASRCNSQLHFQDRRLEAVTPEVGLRFLRASRSAIGWLDSL
jgi:hypothetical protein